MRVRWKLSGGVGLFALGLAFFAAPHPVQAQTPQITNPSFETPDPADATKPLGWYRQTYVNNELPPDPNGPWKYITNGTAGDTTHTGTHSVAVTGGNPGTIYSWEMEGQVAGKGATFNGNVNPDNHGNGPFIQVIPNALYRVSVWYKKTFVGGGTDDRLRYTFSNTAAGAQDDASVWTGGGQSYVDKYSVNEWAQISVDVTVPAGQNRMILRVYGVNVPAGQTIYWDDLSVELLGTPQTFTGTVKNSNGDPIAGAGVGARVDTSNGMDNPNGAATTDASGNFTLNFVPRPGQNVAQAWLENNLTSPNVPLNATGPTNIVYDPTPLADILVGQPIVAASSAETNGDFPPSAAIDGDTGTRWATRGPDIGKEPHYLIVDLGQSIDFSTMVKQSEVWWENARADRYQIRVSDTPPDPAMYTPQNDGNNALILNWGTVVYDSGTGAANNNYQPPNRSDVYIDVLNNFQPGKGRYVALVLLKAGPFPNFSVYEWKLQVPATVVTGQVVDTTGAGVPGAVVVELPGRTNTVTADNNGVFSLTLPQTGAAHTFFAHALTGDKVYSVSNNFTVTPSGPTMDIGKITIGGPADNLIPVGATTDTYAKADPTSDITNSAMPPADAVDHDFTTRWSTAAIPDINTVVTPTNPLYFIVDMGSAQTINHILVDWETARPAAYRVQIATTYDMAGRTGGDWKDVKVSSTPPDNTAIYNMGGDNYVDYIHFAAQSARYIRLVIEQVVDPFTNVSAWEIQAANLTLLPPPPLTLAAQALRIAGGLEAAPSDISSLNVVTTGDSAGKIDIADAVALAQQKK